MPDAALPAAHLERLCDRLRGRIAEREEVSRRYSWARLAIVLGATAAAFMAFQADADTVGWSIVGTAVVVFLGVARFHGRVLGSLRRHRIWLTIKQTHLARLRLAWERLPAPTQGSGNPRHPFENDLNLTGERSMQHLIDTAISQGGSDRLRCWLVQKVPDPQAAVQRQALVRELAPRTLFRDRLTLNGVLVSKDPDTRWDGETLQQWLEQHHEPRSLRVLLGMLLGLSVSTIVLIVFYVNMDIPAFWMLTLVLYIVLYGSRFRFFKSLFEEATYLSDTLRLFRNVFEQLERYDYRRTPQLKQLCQPFQDAERQPSQVLRRVIWISAAASSQKSELLWLLLNSLGPWDLFFAQLLHRQKAVLRERLPVWLDTWYELEAASALATFSYLHPTYAFPEIKETGQEPSVETRGLGHPLLAEADKVRNDFTIQQAGDIAIITGSNMSGKSTFLRTLGVNLCLAYAGGPVDAHAFRTVPFRLFTCINVLDSVNDGISYFYAEVKRLKALLAALKKEHTYPLFFLIDEIFRGTNNRERLIGSQSYIQALAAHEGVGLISTHDLELVRLAEHNLHLRNYHFRETVADGQMLFDYVLRDGPCPTTNALKIMALEGLPVAGYRSQV